MAIPEHMQEWLETEEGFSEAIRIIWDKVLDPNAAEMTGAEVRAELEAAERNARPRHL